jgi:hypothetical protein
MYDCIVSLGSGQSTTQLLLLAAQVESTFMVPRFSMDASGCSSSPESASRPPCGFWCLNEKTIKELMKLC